MAKTILTPIGTAEWPNLKEPDTRFDNDGYFSCKLHVTESDFEEFRSTVDPIVQAAYQAECSRQGVDSIRMSQTDPIRISDDGEFEIYAKQKARVHTRRNGTMDFNIEAIDANGDECEMPDIGAGSTIKMAVEVHTWHMASQGFGYSLRLRAVQIIDLVKKRKGGSAFGFKAESQPSFINWK